MIAIVNQSERRHGTGPQTQILHQPLRRRETQFAVANLIGHLPQIGLLRVRQDDEVVAIAFLIAEEKVLAVRRVDRRPMLLGRFNGRHGGMLVAFVGDAKLAKPRRNGRFLVAGHGTSTAAPVTRPCFRSSRARFASARSYRCVCVLTGTVGASARNFRASSRVRLATDLTTRSSHSSRYGNDGMSLMWIPAHTTMPPGTTCDSAAGT